MTWTQKQRERIIEDAWSGSATCPTDGARLQIRLAEMISGDYRLEASCPTCRQQMTVGRSEDPRRDRFRPWNHEEISALVDAVMQGHVPSCPVCGAGVRADESKANEGTTIALDCMRCGASAERGVARGR